MSKAMSWVLYLENGISNDVPHPGAVGTGSDITHPVLGVRNLRPIMAKLLAQGGDQ